MKKYYETELMDDFSIRDSRIDDALKELKIINNYLGGVSTTVSALKYFTRDKLLSIKIIDVGSGSSDNLIIAKNTYPNLQIISVDKNISVLNYSKNSLQKIDSDAYHPPFKDECCDIVHIALFLHHFNEDQIEKLLNEFLRICKKGIIINDLQRSLLALAGIKLLTVLFSKSILVKNDAPVSVKRSFNKSEIINFLRKSGISNYIIKYKWAFRWMVVIKK